MKNILFSPLLVPLLVLDGVLMLCKAVGKPLFEWTTFQLSFVGIIPSEQLSMCSFSYNTYVVGTMS